MEITSHYRYSAEMFARDGQFLCRFPLEIDWVPAIECAHFELVQRGLCLPQAQPGPVCIEPVWDVTGNGVDRITLQFNGPEQENVSFALNNAYLKAAVESASATVAMQGLVKAGETFDYRIHAAVVPDVHNELNGDELSVVAIHKPLAAQPCRIHSIINAPAGRGAAFAREGDMPVFIAQEAIADTQKLARDDRKQEAGGFLVGRLCRDPDNSAYFLLVTAQIRATHTCSKQDSIRFTTDTWSYLHTELEQRARDEQLLGWWHSHPFFCGNCPVNQRSQCAFSHPFFSTDDRALHRTVFQKAYQVALLLSFLDEGTEPQVDLFGWRGGQIRRCDYVAINENPDSWTEPYLQSSVDVISKPVR